MKGVGDRIDAVLEARRAQVPVVERENSQWERVLRMLDELGAALREFDEVLAPYHTVLGFSAPPRTPDEFAEHEVSRMVSAIDGPPARRRERFWTEPIDALGPGSLLGDPGR